MLGKRKEKEKAVLLIHGDGGHRAKMKSLYKLLDTNCSSVKYIAICENNDCLDEIETKYQFPVIRDKYSRFKTFINLFTSTFKIIYLLFHIKHKYDIKVLLSTGPGICIIPSYFFKLFNVTIIYLETDSRFKTKSLSGKLLHLIADKFYVPNKSLLNLYKKSEYSGRL